MEIAIVLVIIGLIIGGIMAGADMIKQAEMRALMKQIDSFNAATNTFIGKYSCLPGDCPFATTYFPADPACQPDSTRSYMSASNGMTCNGDGNGVIADGATVKGAVEMHLFWQHLSLAGFSAGSFTGTCAYAGDTCSGSNGYTYAANVNVLRAAYGAGLIIIFNTDAEIATYGNGTGIPPNSFYQEHGHHVYQIGGITGTDGAGNRVWNLAPAPAFTVQQAFLLDTKYDDGNPSSGGIHDGSPAGIAMQPGTGDNGCENTTVSPPSYDITTHKNALKCVLMIQSAF